MALPFSIIKHLSLGPPRSRPGRGQPGAPTQPGAKSRRVQAETLVDSGCPSRFRQATLQGQLGTGNRISSVVWSLIATCRRLRVFNAGTHCVIGG